MATEAKKIILRVFREDRQLMNYRPRWTVVTGSVKATILLGQILYWWGKMGEKAFYKFLEPCGHDDYVEGDSWTEELGFTREEVISARAKLGQRVKKGASKTAILKTSMIVWWTDGLNHTFYEVNEELVAERLASLYEDDLDDDEDDEDDEDPPDEGGAESGKPIPVEGAESGKPIPIWESGKPIPIESETTQETTTVEFTAPGDPVHLLPLGEGEDPLGHQRWMGAVSLVCDLDFDEDAGRIGAEVKRLQEHREKNGKTYLTPDWLVEVFYNDYWLGDDWRKKNRPFPDEKTMRSHLHRARRHETTASAAKKLPVDV